LKKGATRLQEITKHFIDVSNAPSTPALYAVETYCTLPFLYTSYSKAVLDIGKGDHDLQIELKKVADPIEAKANEFARGCLDVAARNEVGGPVYNDVLKTWGLEK